MKKKKISNKVLKTELSYAISMIDGKNYGYAKDIISQVLSRVMEYNMEEVKVDEKEIN